MGAVYDNGPLQVQGMLNRIEHQTGVFRDSHAGYLLAGYRLGTVTPFAGVSWWKTSASAGSTGLPESAPFAEINRAFASSLAVSVAGLHRFFARRGMTRKKRLAMPSSKTGPIS